MKSAIPRLFAPFRGWMQSAVSTFRKPVGWSEGDLGRTRRGTPLRDLVDRVSESKLTYLSRQKLESLALTCQEIERRQIPGCVIEAGCALGGSAIVIASCKESSRLFRVYDVFGMIPPPTEKDPPEVHERYQTIFQGLSEGIGGDKYYGYEPQLLELVVKNLSNFGINTERESVELVQGMVEDTMVLQGSVAFAHIDVDWYSPVLTCLQRIVPRLSKGGSVILDDYHYYGGCRTAVDEYFASDRRGFRFDDSAGSMKITRR